MYLDAKNMLGNLFEGPVATWTEAQKQLAFWLRYYDAFYERSCTEDIIKPEMVEYDVIVDAFFIWHEHKMRQERRENTVGANVPKATDHSIVLKPKHQ